LRRVCAGCARFCCRGRWKRMNAKAMSDWCLGLTGLGPSLGFLRATREVWQFAGA
jgi:hypothetical protein